MKKQENALNLNNSAEDFFFNLGFIYENGYSVSNFESSLMILQ